MLTPYKQDAREGRSHSAVLSPISDMSLRYSAMTVSFSKRAPPLLPSQQYPSPASNCHAGLTKIIHDDKELNTYASPLRISRGPRDFLCSDIHDNAQANKENLQDAANSVVPTASDTVTPNHKKTKRGRNSIKRKAAEGRNAREHFRSQSSSSILTRPKKYDSSGEENYHDLDALMPGVKLLRASPIDEEQQDQSASGGISVSPGRPRSLALSLPEGLQHICALPRVDPDASINYITPDTLADLLSGNKYNDCYDEVLCTIGSQEFPISHSFSSYIVGMHRRLPFQVVITCTICLLCFLPVVEV